MDIAGLVKVKVVADLSELETGLAAGRRQAEKFDNDASKGLDSVGKAGRRSGDEVSGAARRAAIGQTEFLNVLGRIEASVATVNGSLTRLIAASEATAQSTARLSEVNATTATSANAAAVGLGKQGAAAIEAATATTAAANTNAAAAASASAVATTSATAAASLSGQSTAATRSAVAMTAIAAANDNASVSATRAGVAYDGLNKAMALASRAIGAIAGAAIGSALIQFSDTWSDLSSRVGIAVRNLDLAPAVMERIGKTARMTYSSLDLTVEGFVRNATVLNELGKSTKQQLDYQEALNNALVVSGAKGRAAEFVQESLNRSMALGAMRGIELNNVLNYGGRIAELLAKHFNTTTGGLMKMAQQGKITGAVLFDVLTKNMETLRKEAESMPATISDGFTLMRNALLQTIGVFDQAGQLSGNFANALVFIADNMDRIITYGATAVTMYGTYYVAAFVAANAATVTLSGALTVLRGALIRTGIGALIVGAGELVYQFSRMVEATGSFTGAMAEMSARSKLLLEAVIWSFTSAADAIQSVWYGAMSDIVRATEDGMGSILRLLGVSAETVGKTIKFYSDKAKNNADASKTSAGIAAETFGRAFGEIKIPEATIPGGGGAAVKSLGEVDKAAQKAAKSYNRIVESAREFIASQQLEAQVIGLTEVEANKLRYTQDLLNQAKRAGITLTVAQTAELTGLAAQMAEAEAKTKALKDALDFAKDVGKGFVTDFLNGIEQGKSVWSAFADAAINALNKIADKLIDMAMDQMISGLFGSQFGGGLNVFPGGGSLNSTVGLWAKGGAFANGISGFSNTIVDRATPFRFANGAGIMGEAGPEGILPLRRNGQGQLGVIATGTANNNQPPAANNNGTSTVRLIMPDGWQAEVLEQAAGQTVEIVRANNAAQENRYQNGAAR